MVAKDVKTITKAIFNIYLSKDIIIGISSNGEYINKYFNKLYFSFKK